MDKTFTWRDGAVILGRLIFAALFIMAAGFKFADINATAGYIASAGFPAAVFLAWCAAIFETLLVIAFLTGAYFPEACLLGAIYVVFLAFAFHMPTAQSTPEQFGAFISHFPFAAGLLFAAAHGPGRLLASRLTCIGYRGASDGVSWRAEGT